MNNFSMKKFYTALQLNLHQNGKDAILTKISSKRGNPNRFIVHRIHSHFSLLRQPGFRKRQPLLRRVNEPDHNFPQPRPFKRQSHSTYTGVACVVSSTDVEPDQHREDSAVVGGLPLLLHVCQDLSHLSVQVLM